MVLTIEGEHDTRPVLALGVHAIATSACWEEKVTKFNITEKVKCKRQNETLKVNLKVSGLQSTFTAKLC